MGFKRINSSTPPDQNSQQTIDSLWKKPNHSRTSPKIQQKKKDGVNLLMNAPQDTHSARSPLATESDSDKKPSALTILVDKEHSSHSSAADRIENIRLTSDDSTTPPSSGNSIITLDPSLLTTEPSAQDTGKNFLQRKVQGCCCDHQLFFIQEKLFSGYSYDFGHSSHPES
jgi:hypothetical protein